MLPQTTELAQLLQQLHGLYIRALELGASLVSKDEEGMATILDERYRIMQRATPMAQKAKELKTWLGTQNLTPSEKAFILEQVRRVKDLGPKFLEQDRRLQAILKQRLAGSRSELVQHHQNVQAIRQYLAAPAAKPLV